MSFAAAMVHAPLAASGPLPAGAIACWVLDLEQPPAIVAALTEILAPDERARADRFAFERDRRRFVVARAGLRILLGRSLGMRPSAVALAYGPNGKPELPPGAAAPIHFNVSHSGDLAALALAHDLPLGVDVEAVRALPDLLAIAGRFFAPEEAAAIAAAPTSERALTFFLCWTRKEAFTKASGDGLSLGLDRFRVTCRPGEPARLLEIDGSPERAAEWTVVDLRPAPDYVGAVVFRGGPRPLSVRRLRVTPEALQRPRP